MKVVLANLPWKVNNRYGVRGGSRWPFTIEQEEGGRRNYVPFPFLLAYAASFLKKYGKEAVLIDAVSEGIEEDLLMERVAGLTPDAIVIESSAPSFKNDVRIAEEIKRDHRDLNIIFVGPHVSSLPSETLSEHKAVDYVLIGEFEHALLCLVNFLEKRGPKDKIPGLAYRENGYIRINKGNSAVEDINDLPWPERETLLMYKYNDGFCGLPKPNVQMSTSRGCPYKCMFCLWPQTMHNGHSYRKRKPEKVIDELAWLVEKYDFKAVYFDDDTFNIDRDHVLAICSEIKKRKIHVPWAAMARADLMDEEVLRCLSKSGLYAIKYGIESADEKILELCKKNMDLGRTRKVIKLTRDLGIKVHLTFCLGLPGENHQSIQKTTRFIEDVEPDSLQISFATPFPGTEYFDYIKDRGWLISNDWSDFDGNYKSVVRTQELSCKDMERIRIDLRSRFNF